MLIPISQQLNVVRVNTICLYSRQKAVFIDTINEFVYRKIAVYIYLFIVITITKTVQQRHQQQPQLEFLRGSHRKLLDLITIRLRMSDNARPTSIDLHACLNRH